VAGWLGFDISSLNKCTSAGWLAAWAGGWVWVGRRRAGVDGVWVLQCEWRRRQRGLRPRRELHWLCFAAAAWRSIDLAPNCAVILLYAIYGHGTLSHAALCVCMRAAATWQMLRIRIDFSLSLARSAHFALGRVYVCVCARPLSAQTNGCVCE
jgi:hypothetical protein